MRYNTSIIGVGNYIPKGTITNKDIILSGVDTDEGWITKNLGIEQRYIHDGEMSDMAIEASFMAIKNANISPVDIDMIIVGTTMPEKIAPSTASIVRKKIGAVNSVVFDINAVCSSFLFAQDIALRYNDVYETILIIGVDQFSNITDFSRRDCVFFGDGAGAVVLHNGVSEGGFIYSRIDSDSEDYMAFNCDHEGTFNMRGRGVYDRATVLVPEIINRVLKEARMEPSYIDWVIPHQPSLNILKEVSIKTGIAYDKFMMNMDKHANTASAAIPILLSELWNANHFNKGDIILFTTIGAGWTYGASIYRV